MGNLERWLKYAKAKLDHSLKTGNERLDEMEARQRAAAEERPWLAAEGDAPTLEEARARIEWEEQRAARRREEAERAGSEASGGPAASSGASGSAGRARPSGADRPAGSGAGDPGVETGGDEAGPAGSGHGAGTAGPGAGSTSRPAGRAADPLAPATTEETAARTAAQLELEQREREAAVRLDAIRAELGIEPPASTDGDDPEDDDRQGDDRGSGA